jgi:CRP-like cAMP-binding protein
MMMTKDAMAHRVQVPRVEGAPLGVRRPGLGNDGGLDLDARKRRILRRSPIASAASPEAQTKLADGGTIHRVGKGRLLVTQGDAVTSVALLSIGRVRLVRSTSDGKTLALGYRGAGDLVGEAGLGGVATHRDSAVATEDVEALVLPLSLVRGLLASDAAMCSATLATLMDRHQDTEDRLASLLFRNVEARLAEFLLKATARWGIPDPRGVLIAAPFTHQEMASMIGSTRETVTLTLGELRRRGVIEIDRRRIVVLDREALRSRI